MKNWVPVPGYDHIEVSSLGQVRSTLTRDKRGHRLSIRVLKQHEMPNGYLTVTLKRPGRDGFCPVLVHRLICLGFHGQPRTGEQVRHLDGTRKHNAALNLKWGNGVENQRDRKLHGTHLECENAPGAKLSNAEVVSIRQRIRNGEIQRRIAKEFNVSTALINKVVKGKTYCHAEACSVPSPL